MKSLLIFGVGICLLICSVARSQESAKKLTNQDVIEMVNLGLSDDVVIAKIQSAASSDLTLFDTSIEGLKQLKAAKVSDAVIRVMVSPKATAVGPARSVDELTSQFTRLQNSVLTVWSEVGHGTGFIVDPRGVILTNQHVVGPSEVLAVQFDAKTKIPATLLAADPDKDVAVLWANLAAVPGAIVAPIATAGTGQTTVMEGENVFTIGSPLSQRKILTRGIVSKVEPGAIISDININHGNSGGPLFNSLGQVVGITTFHEGSSGSGLSGIVRIEEAKPLIAEAQTMMATTKEPEARLLPVEPERSFPLDAIKAALSQGRFDTRPYVFSEGDYDIAIVTPIFKYSLEESGSVAATKEHEKRLKKKRESVKGTFEPLGDLKNWQEYAGEYKPVILIQASPHLRETFGSALARGLANPRYAGPAKMRFKTDFYKMSLLCGQKEVEPIQQGKIAEVVNARNAFVNVSDATYQGLYEYGPDAISPACGGVTLMIYSEKDPNKATAKPLNDKTVERIWNDFAPYRESAN